MTRKISVPTIFKRSITFESDPLKVTGTTLSDYIKIPNGEVREGGKREREWKRSRTFAEAPTLDIIDSRRSEYLQRAFVLDTRDRTGIGTRAC